MLEENLRRALLINRGDWTPALFSSPLAITLAAVAVMVLVVTVKMNVGAKLATVGRAEAEAEPNEK